MKKAFEDQHWKLTDEQTPSERFMEKRLDMVEKCQWKAEPLSEVLGVLEDDEPWGLPRVDAKGNSLRFACPHQPIPSPRQPIVRIVLSIDLSIDLSIYLSIYLSIALST